MNLRQRVQELLEFLATNPPPEQVYEKFYAEDVIDLSTQDGYRIRIEELAMQTWKDGLIIHERFFYDPGNIQGEAKEINAIH